MTFNIQKDLIMRNFQDQLEVRRMIVTLEKNIFSENFAKDEIILF